MLGTYLQAISKIHELLILKTALRSANLFYGALARVRHIRMCFKLCFTHAGHVSWFNNAHKYVPGVDGDVVL